MDDARIEISNVCNYKCVFCPVHKQMRRREFMSDSLFKLILIRIKGKYNHITLSGMGEPMLHPHFFEFLEMAKDFRITVITNGSKLNKESLLKMKGVETIRVSWYDLEEQRKMLNEILPLDRTTKINLYYSPPDVGQYGTVKFIDDFKDRADMIEVWTLHNWGDAFDYRKVQDEKTSCGRINQDTLQVQVDGTVVMCCLSWDNQLPLGNLKNQTVGEIYEGSLYKRLTSNNFKGLICENCEFRNKTKEEILYYSNAKIEDRTNKTSTTFTKLA